MEVLNLPGLLDSRIHKNPQNHIYLFNKVSLILEIKIEALLSVMEENMILQKIMKYLQELGNI
jgi:hypothetical protein